MIGWREHGSKPGSGGSNSETAIQINKRERLRQLAMDTIDLSKDPYILRNHIGTFECKLCLTLHSNEGNYLAHTQGKRHQQNLARRAAKGNEGGAMSAPNAQPRRIVPKRTIVKIGRPGYKYSKSKNPETGQYALLFEIAYPEIEAGLQPRHRFLSAFEQKQEQVDKNWQYLLFAAEPYETIAFKIPNRDIERSIDSEPGKGGFYTSWDKDSKTFTLQLTFRRLRPGETMSMPPPQPPQQFNQGMDDMQMDSNPLPPPGFGGVW